MAEYLEKMAETEFQIEIKSIEDLLKEIKNEKLYSALLTMNKHPLQIILLKMQGYSTKEIALLLQVTEKTFYRRMDKLRENLKFFRH